jgi:hypothetical protein
MIEISWTDLVRNEVLQSVEEDRNIQHTAHRRTADLMAACVGTAFQNILLKER